MFDIAPARSADLQVSEEMRDEAARWLHSKGTTNGNIPGPPAKNKQSGSRRASLPAKHGWFATPRSPRSP